MSWEVGVAPALNQVLALAFVGVEQGLMVDDSEHPSSFEVAVPLQAIKLIQMGLESLLSCCPVLDCSQEAVLVQECRVDSGAFHDEIFTDGLAKNLGESIRRTHFLPLGQQDERGSETGVAGREYSIEECKLGEGETDDLALCNGKDGFLGPNHGFSESLQVLSKQFRDLFSVSELIDVGVGEVGQVVSGRVVAAIPVDDDELDILVLISGDDEIPEGGIHVGREGVVALGTVESDPKAVASDL